MTRFPRMMWLQGGPFHGQVREAPEGGCEVILLKHLERPGELRSLLFELHTYRAVDRIRWTHRSRRQEDYTIRHVAMAGWQKGMKPRLVFTSRPRRARHADVPVPAR
tara:strand:+ start:518 stop:838 length:321 start_codon:yes stop_codon:yes gene_type:complete